MADARSLLRTKQQQTTQISHPLATYSSTGQLRCIACSIPIKQASQWAGHVGSKAHRVNVGKMKEREKVELGKRKQEEMAQDEEGERDEKRMKVDEQNESRPTVDAVPTATRNGGSGFPADFFSDPSQGPILGASVDSDDEDGDTEMRPPAASSSSQPSTATTSVPKTAIDLEFEAFQRELALSSNTEESKHEVYAAATVFSEPVLASTVPEGFPPSATNEDGAVDSESMPVEMTEEEKKAEEERLRKEKEQDERELIMDRLMEEERAQEEADEKARVLKERVEAFKRRRAGKKESKK
ncbi:hypothetical protein DL96DRAFT_1616656 [Flagelloscypha sp. PMI_526]|nr:hypothetical protein DL96DRAFT_1616656 [Flagelloscypha sp. PMI_526]